MTTPKVFISYSYDSNDHIVWVRKLGTSLMNSGIEVILDQWDLPPGGDIASFMESSVTAADRVLLVCTETYVAKANEGRGGVGYERLIVSAEIVARIHTTKFIPIIRDNPGAKKLPNFLGERRYLDFSSATDYEARIEELARELHGTPALAKPPLGQNPFSATPPADVGPARSAGPSGLLPSGRSLLSEPWFDECSDVARKGIAKLPLKGWMEIRFGLHEVTRKSQIELLNAVRLSEVHTFGWPIAITLENREDSRPKPFADGIRAEISRPNSVLDGESSYDYWAARTNGDFFTLQSLFEDMRGKDKLFFNTRIVRITEGLMFASGFYQNLGVPPDSRMSITFVHQGLANRTIGSSTLNRQVWPRIASEDRSEGQITDSIAGLRKDIVDHVMKIAAPMFMLFDFAEFQRPVYEDIVNGFVAGHVR
jgi:hypothetical protein